MADPKIPEGLDEGDLRRMMRRVLEAERERLHMITPQGINNNIQDIIEEEVQ